jgi:hypothetical protein
MWFLNKILYTKYLVVTWIREAKAPAGPPRIRSLINKSMNISKKKLLK